MFVTEKGCNSYYIHVLFDELGEYFCTLGKFRAVFTYWHKPYYEYTIKACNPKPAKKEVVAIQTPAGKVIRLGLTSLFTTLSIYKCIMCKIVSDYIYLTVRGEGK